MSNFILITVQHAKVEYWKSSDGSWTTIPGFSHPSFSNPRCVDGTIDDLWVGMDGSGIAPYNKPWLKHWNGSSWSEHFITAQGTSGIPIVGVVFWVSATEAYCLANQYSGEPDAGLCKWNGSSWSQLGTTNVYGDRGQIFANGTRIFCAGIKYSYYDRYYRYDGGMNNDGDGDSSVNCVAVTGRQNFDHMYSYKSNGKLRVKQYGGSFSQIADDAGSPNSSPCLKDTPSYIWTCYKDESSRTHVVRRDAITGANADDSNSMATYAYAKFVVLGDGDYQFVADSSGVRRRQHLGSWTTINRGGAVVALCGYEASAPPILQNQSPAPGGTVPVNGPPIIAPINPLDNATRVGKNTSIRFFVESQADNSFSLDLVSNGSGVNPVATKLSADGDIFWENETAAPGWNVTVTSITDGYRYTVQISTPLANPGAALLVGVYAEDESTPAQILNTSYSIYTAGIDLSTVSAWVNEVLAIDSGVEEVGWSLGVEASDTGYWFTLRPTSRDTYFNYGETVFARAYGEDTVGGTNEGSWSFQIEAEPSLEGHYLTTFDFPLRFQPSCDIVKTHDEKALNDNIQISVFVRKYGIPLFPLGVGVEEFCFEPMDIPTKAALSMHLRDGIDLGVDGLKVNGDITFIEDPTQNKLSIAVPYLNTKVSKNQQSVISAPKTKVD